MLPDNSRSLLPVAFCPFVAAQLPIHRTTVRKVASMNAWKGQLDLEIMQSRPPSRLSHDDSQGDMF